ncbi:hypothetical protein HYT02_03035 [Candidatus Gottesmanbacteria bacterium]|nr:hypothetical protein [Candidatus Gottesmanbacteria bacterium]
MSKGPESNTFLTFINGNTGNIDLQADYKTRLEQLPAREIVDIVEDGQQQLELSVEPDVRVTIEAAFHTVKSKAGNVLERHVLQPQVKTQTDLLTSARKLVHPSVRRNGV